MRSWDRRIVAKRYLAVWKMCGILFTFLLSSQSYLSSHDSLSLSNQIAVRTSAVFPFAEAFVSFKDGNNAMVAAACTFR